MKKALLFLIVFLGFASIGDISIYLTKIPSFEALQITEGVVFSRPKGVPSGRNGAPFTLSVDDKLLSFNCSLTTRLNHNCVGKNIAHYQNKPAKVWWYKAPVFFFFNTQRLLQLEVENQTIISYSEQKEKYLKQKNSHFPAMIALFLITVFISLKLK